MLHWISFAASTITFVFAFELKLDVHVIVSQDPAEVATLVELKVLSDLFIPPEPSLNDKGNTQYTQRRGLSLHVFWLVIDISSFIELDKFL